MKKDFYLFAMFISIIVIVYLFLNINQINSQERGKLPNNLSSKIENIAKTEKIIKQTILNIKGKGPKTLGRGASINNKKENVLYDEDGKLVPPLTILLLGDSNMLEGYGPALESDLIGNSEISVIRVGKYSTGLNNIVYYDWYSTTEELINIHKPDLIVMMIGANDGQSIIDEQGNSIDFYTDQWSNIYASRINTYLTKFSSKVKRIYWVGLTMPKNEEDQVKYKKINKITMESINTFGSKKIIFINGWDQFTINGLYSNIITNQNNEKIIVKQSDGIHLTVEGGKHLSSITINEMKKDINFDYWTK